MKHSLPLIALLAFFFISCDDDPSGPPPSEPITETRITPDFNYVKNTFFLVDHPTSFLGAFPYSIEVFVTVTPQDLILDPSIVRFPGWAIADSTAEGGGIADAVAEIQAGGVPEHALQQDFRLLRRDVDYSVLATQDTVAIGIELKPPIPATALRSVAVRYRNQLNQTIGGTLGTSPDTLVTSNTPPPLPCAMRYGTKRSVSLTTLVRFVATSASYSVRESSRCGPKYVTPAFRITAWTGVPFVLSSKSRSTSSARRSRSAS